MPLDAVEEMLLAMLVTERLAEGLENRQAIMQLVNVTEEQLRTAIRAYGDKLLPRLRQRVADDQADINELEQKISRLEAYLAS